MSIHLPPQIPNRLLMILQFLPLRPSLLVSSIPYSTRVLKLIMIHLGSLALVGIMVAPKL